MTFRIFITLKATALAALAAGPPLLNFCEPFTCDGCEITWSVTNPLPATAKIWKVAPSKFSTATISNLLQLAELTEKDKKRPMQAGVFSGKDVRSYGNRMETRHLDLVPSEGFIIMVNSEAISAPRELAEGVPTAKEALDRALAMLHQLAYPDAELTRNRSGKVGTQSVGEAIDVFKEKPSGVVRTNLLARTVSLGRSIDGIPVWTANIMFKFGNHGRVAELEIVRRAVEPLKAVSVPTKDEFAKFITQGGTLIRNGEMRAFRKLNITGVKLYYWENFGSEPQKLIYPFAVMEASTDLSGKSPKIEIFVPFANE